MMHVSRQEVVIGSDTEFHMLRHFSVVDEGMLASIRDKGHSDREIEVMLKAPGSRFHADFSKSIDGLIEVLFSRPYLCSKGISGNLELQWIFSGVEYPSGVGIRSVESLVTLTKKEREACYIIKNRGMDLMHLDVEALPVTWDCTLVLKPLKAGYLFITSFPGTPALPLPHSGMEPEAQDVCKAYWDRHVFLVEMNGNRGS